VYMMLSKADNLAWLCRRLKEYQDHKVHTGEVIEDFEDFGKLGQGFASVDDLEEIDIGDSKVKRSTYISVRLSGSHKQQLGELLKEFLGCFAWNYTEMPRLGRDLVEHTLPMKKGFRCW
jgi:hypothetical protein